MHNLIAFGILVLFVRFLAPLIGLTAVLIFFFGWVALLVLGVYCLFSKHTSAGVICIIAAIPWGLFIHDFSKPEPYVEPVAVYQPEPEPEKDPSTIFVDWYNPKTKEFARVSLEQCREMYREQYCDRLGCSGPRNTVTLGICNVF